MITLVLADCDMKVSPEHIDKSRSRTDLVHFSLLLAQDSELSEEREVRTIVHTRENKVYQFEADIEIPPRLEDFEEMLVKSYHGERPKGIIYSEETLMEALEGEYGEKLVLSQKGKRIDPIEMFSRGKDYIVVMGGFLEGDFVSPVYKWTDRTISISDRLMKPWSVTAEMLVGYRYCSLE
ncbi:MAG: hypothetical protein ACLFVB_02570 [Thermoplasmata archaeon]